MFRRNVQVHTFLHEYRSILDSYLSCGSICHKTWIKMPGQKVCQQVVAICIILRRFAGHKIQQNSKTLLRQRIT
ncbi:unnamed protein product [Haemonchus placei]|uniref:Ovule protein n=1 Tax=Haemonchus placei TaxID=6290 RepID=A0A0N4WH45_HAEPC|nr:unnamed protein product [Haemonchus placei]